jgi:hypothetical protein
MSHLKKVPTDIITKHLQFSKNVNETLQLIFGIKYSHAAGQGA